MSSRLEAKLSLVTNGQNAHFILRYHKPVKYDVTSLSIGNYQLAHLAFETAADQRMRRKVIDCRLDSYDCVPRCGRVLVA